MRFKTLSVLALFIFSLGCSDKTTKLSNIEGVLADSEALIVNSLGETLSALYKNDSRTIVNDLEGENGGIFNTGSAPNQILVKNKLAYIVNSTSNNVQVVNLEALKTVTEISTGIGSNPYFMAFYDNDSIYVTNVLGSDNNGNVVQIRINTDGTYEVTDTIEMPSGDELEPFGDPSSAGPQGIAVSNSKIYVSLTNLAGWFAGGPGFVVVIDPLTNSIIKKIRTSGLNASYVYVSKYVPNKIYVLQSGTFTGDGLIDIIDTTTDEIVETINTGGAPYSMTITESQISYVGDALGPHLFSFHATDYSILNDSTNPIEIVDPEETPYNFISYIDVTKDGYLFALAFNSDELYVLDPQNAAIIDGPFLTGDGPITMVLDN